jgi:hypothetical protein
LIYRLPLEERPPLLLLEDDRLLPLLTDPLDERLLAPLLMDPLDDERLLL